jgi:Protein of unknown function (DUF2815)
MAQNPLCKVITGPVRLSYAHLFEPFTSFEDQPAKFSTVILIPKTDTKTLRAIEAAQQAALEDGKSTKFKGKIPANWTNTLHDGDEEADLEVNPEYAGHMYMSISNRTKPGIVDRMKQKIEDPAEVYSGCWVRVSMNAAPYAAAGNKGVSFFLNNVQKIRDDEPLAGGSSADADFDELPIEDDVL